MLEFHAAGGEGDPGTTVTLRSTSFLSDEDAASQFRKLQVSANTIVLNLEPNATLAADSLGTNSYFLTANDDRLGAIAAFPPSHSFLPPLRMTTRYFLTLITF